MSNPQPLTRPDGTVHAYACGSCGHISASWSHYGPWNEDDVERTHEEAASCCVCRTCKREVGRDALSGLLCRECNEKQSASWAAKAEAQRAADCDSWENAVAHHDYAWTFALDNGRTGRLYSGDDYAGVFTSAWARLDPTEDDPQPEPHGQTLQRYETSTPMDALARLAYAYDSQVVRVERITADALTAG